jgi:hypothetical protein
MKENMVSGGHTRRDVLRLATVSAVGLVLSNRNPVAGAVGGSVGSSGPLRSAGVLAFGQDNVLFVGDITGVAVHAFALRATDFTSQADVELGNFHNFEGRDLVRGLDGDLGMKTSRTYLASIKLWSLNSASSHIFRSSRECLFARSSTRGSSVGRICRKR